MDYEELSRQLIRALRGHRSQPALSRWLGFESNVLYTWESGRRWPTAANFFYLCQKVGVDLDPSLNAFLGGTPDELVAADWTARSSAARLLNHLRGATPVVELARRVGTNRVSVARWLKNEAEPRLPDFLHLIEAASGRVLDFLACLTEVTKLREATDAWRKLQAQRQVAYELPWSHAVLRVLELTHYQRLSAHSDQWVADRLGIQVDTATRCLEALADSGLIQRRGRHYRLTEVGAVDTRQNPRAGRALKRHWAQVAEARLPALEGAKSDLFSYALCSVSERDWERLRELHMGYHQELRRVITDSEPAERVVLINLQLLRLDEIPEALRIAQNPSLEA